MSKQDVHPNLEMPYLALTNEHGVHMVQGPGVQQVIFLDIKSAIAAAAIGNVAYKLGRQGVQRELRNMLGIETAPGYPAQLQLF